jgi:hypothetical protein
VASLRLYEFGVPARMLTEIAGRQMKSAVNPGSASEKDQAMVRFNSCVVF